jgi:hypothetical protein
VGPLRVVFITVGPAIAEGYTEIVRTLGHEPLAVGFAACLSARAGV